MKETFKTLRLSNFLGDFHDLQQNLLWLVLGEAKSTLDRRSALHLFRLGEAMLRIVRNKNRPLLHMIRAWSVVAPHLVEVGNSSGEELELTHDLF